MTDLLPRTVETIHVPTPPFPMAAVSPRRPQPAARQRGRWSLVIVLLVMDWMVAMFLIGTVLFPDPVPVDGSAPSSSVPSSVVAPPATDGGEPVAAHADSHRREGGGPEGDPGPTLGVTTSTTASSPVVPDAAPARGQTSQGPAGGPASTDTTASTTTTGVPVEAPVSLPTQPEPDPAPVPPDPPVDPPPDPVPPETTPSTETAP
jgi:hypothetical protein